MKYLGALTDISVADVKVDLMRTAYANDRALLNTFDPRIVLLWTVLFTVIPWLLNLDAGVSAESAAIVGTALSRGVETALTSQEVGIDAVGAVIPFFLKLTIISVISLAVFSAMSPRKISKGMLRLGVPRQLTFAIAYGYRMMPLLVEEYHDLINSFRLRSKVPENRGLLNWRYFYYLLKLSIKAFYPLIFNVAKRARVTVVFGSLTFVAALWVFV